MKIKMILSALFLFLPCIKLSAANYDTILIVGFRNLGDPNDDNINVVLTKSLINWLSMIEDVRVVNYESVEKTVAANGFLKAATVDTNVIEMMGMHFVSRKIVFGNYKIDTAKNLITLNYSIYDLRSGQVYLTRSLQGTAGLDIFDTIDEMSKKVTIAAAGRDINFSDLSDNAPTRLIHFTTANTIVVPACIAATVAGGLILNGVYNSSLNGYQESVNAYYTAASASDDYYLSIQNSYNTLVLEKNLQIGCYAAAGALTVLETVLLFSNPENVHQVIYPTIANTVLVPLSIISTAVGGYLMNNLYQTSLDNYNSAYDAYLSGGSDLDANYQLMSDYYGDMKLEKGLQIGLYAASGVLTGLEIYLLFRKPPANSNSTNNTVAQNIRWIALPNYFGITYSF